MRLLEARDRSLKVFLPQSFEEGDNAAMFKRCIDGVNAADAVVAILDGPDADSGTCIEIGFALAKGKPVIGIRTDSRECQDRGLNLMVSYACSRLIQRSNVSMTVENLVDEVVAALGALK